eukprot:TRINITY_DN198_c0_g1_i1.p1 TRINITY_DN198_c0_g1~~TRINITY_DN198_c0_g1_i1.p1  ORF type:complete len:235 (+),score=41.01 TRINITY_DN198_c0_g1_i1:79-705(+)
MSEQEAIFGQLDAAVRRRISFRCRMRDIASLMSNALINQRHRSAADKAVVMKWTTELLEALAPYVPLSPEEERLQQQGVDLKMCMHTAPSICREFDEQLISTDLPWGMRLYFVYLLGFHDINTFLLARYLTHRSPCFKGVPVAVVQRFFAAMAQIEATESKGTAAGGSAGDKSQWWWLPTLWSYFAAADTKHKAADTKHEDAREKRAA